MEEKRSKSPDGNKESQTRDGIISAARFERQYMRGLGELTACSLIRTIGTVVLVVANVIPGNALVVAGQALEARNATLCLPLSERRRRRRCCWSYKREKPFLVQETVSVVVAGEGRVSSLEFERKNWCIRAKSLQLSGIFS